VRQVLNALEPNCNNQAELYNVLMNGMKL
jgi:hypothetical protein